MNSATDRFDAFTGCMLGGAVGDALGAPVEFLSRAQIISCYGEEGITTYRCANGNKAQFTDDTQLSLFAAEGLLCALARSDEEDTPDYRLSAAAACLRWLSTQGHTTSALHAAPDEGWLVGIADLHRQRAPGLTCLDSLGQMQHLDQLANNHSKGCGSVMRVAPIGLFFWRMGAEDAMRQAFMHAAEHCAITHGHPSAQLSGGVLAAVIVGLLEGSSLPVAIERSKALLCEADGHEETLAAINTAMCLAASGADASDAIRALGQGWVAAEALAIALFCALRAKDFRDGVILAVNHDGDSDSTGAITGNLLGTLYGEQAIPQVWSEQLALGDVVRRMAIDLYHCHDRWRLIQHYC